MLLQTVHVEGDALGHLIDGMDPGGERGRRVACMGFDPVQLGQANHDLVGTR